ncbi:MAG TPA: cupin domain-containing protein [Actinomycetales bacterium]|nr:cupin domain-containing protein [Actinomycetales bacterium]
MDVVLVSDGGGEVLAGPNRIRILEDGSNTGHRIGFLEARLPPGSGGPPQHIHRAHSETFYVVSGTMRFASADTDVDVSAGGLVTAPVGAPHTFSNPDPDEWAIFICTVAPDLYIGYFREMTALAARDGRVDEDAALAVMARYATDPYHPTAHRSIGQGPRCGP